MFQPRSFKLEDFSLQKQIIERFPLATLISHSNGELTVNHIPLLLEEVDGQMYLLGHVAKANGFYKELKESDEVLCVFHGPNAYISPSWYPSKSVDGRAVPTWNYASVHAYGNLSTTIDPTWLKNHLSKASFVHEQNQDTPWTLDEAPKDYVETLLKAIVGIKIKVSKVIANNKMNQNHPRENIEGVIGGLKDHNKNEVAQWMEESNQ